MAQRAGRIGTLFVRHERRRAQGLLKKSLEAEQFEEFLHRTFVGAKRSRLRATKHLYRADEIVRQMAEVDVNSILVGMAHRGRERPRSCTGQGLQQDFLGVHALSE